MRYYGALWRRIPVTFAAMTIGTLAITGVGIMQIGGVPAIGFAGYFSKDSIIEHAFASGAPFGGLAFFAGVFAALLTSFYSWRLVFLTFFGDRAGRNRSMSSTRSTAIMATVPTRKMPATTRANMTWVPPSSPPAPAATSPHESPWTILIPLIALSAGAVAAGFVYQHAFVGPEEAPHFWAGSIAFDVHLAHLAHAVPLWVKLAPGAVMLIGLLTAWYAYIRDTAFPVAAVGQFGVLYRFFLHKWYFDEIYDALLVRPAVAFGRFLWKRGDEGTIDRFGPDGAAAAIVAGTRLTAFVQTGYVYTYALVMLLGVAAAATWAMAQ